MNQRNEIINGRSQKDRVKRAFFRAMTLFAVMACGVFPSMAETLDDAYRAALAGDYRVKSSDESVAAAEESVAAAKAYRYPSLKGAGSYTWLDDTPSTSVRILPILPTLTFPLMKDDTYWMSDLTLSVPVFTGFRITHGVRAAEAALDAGQAGRLTTVQDVKLKTAESYVAVLRAGHGLEVAKSNVTALTAHARDVANAYGKGLVPKNDVLAVQVALADARQMEIRVENILALARAAYNRQVGRPLDTPVTLDDLDRPEDGASSGDLDGVTRRAMDNRSELRELAGQARAYGYKAKSTRAGLLPQIQVAGSFYHVTHTLLDDENIWAGSVGVRWDIFDGGVILHQARSEERKAAAIDGMKRETETLIRLQVRQAVLDVSETEKRIAVTRDALAQAEENLKIAKNRYNRDIGNNTEVLDAETLRVNSMTNHVNAVYDLVMAKLRLKRASGDL